MQVVEELSVGEAVAHVMGPVHGQSRLAHSGCAADHGHAGSRRISVHGGQVGVQFADLPVAAGERGDVRGKFGGDVIRAEAGGVGAGVGAAVPALPAECPEVGLLQFGAGLDAEAVSEPVA